MTKSWSGISVGQGAYSYRAITMHLPYGEQTLAIHTSHTAIRWQARRINFSADDGTYRDSYGVTLGGRKGEVTKEVQDWLDAYSEEEDPSLPF